MEYQSNEINDLAKALNKAQTEELFALKDSTNPFFKSKYADLSSVWDVARKPLTDNGLAVVQTMGQSEDGNPVIITTLMHISGQWIRGHLTVNPVKDDPQALGSAITYGRRYSLSAILGICPDDDDAEKGMSRNSKKPAAKKAAGKKAPESPDTPDGEMSSKQWNFISKCGKDEGLSKDETVELVKWVAGELNVEPRHWKVAKSLLPLEAFQGQIEKYNEHRMVA